MIILSGGQTGTDRGALEAARALKFPTGGWAPKGWMTENGPDPGLAEFGLVESAVGYADRTRRNVLDADAVLILADQPQSTGSRLTFKEAQRHGRPVEVFYSIASPERVEEILWRWRQHERILVAGNRESVAPGIQARVEKLLLRALAPLR